jgi:hypothetical protein
MINAAMSTAPASTAFLALAGDLSVKEAIVTNACNRHPPTHFLMMQVKVIFCLVAPMS